MILVVDGERTLPVESLEAALDLDSQEISRVATPAEARHWCDTQSPSLVILACEFDAAADLIRDLRQGKFDNPTVPIVALVEEPTTRERELGVDETVETPLDENAFRTAVERAFLLGEYKTAVDEFFELSQEFAASEDDLPALTEPWALLSARDHADECLEKLRTRERGIPFDRLLNDA